jgi:hypothetical protein
MSSVNRQIRIVTGEPGDGKLSRRVREGGIGKGPQGTSPMPYLSGRLSHARTYNRDERGINLRGASPKVTECP